MKTYIRLEYNRGRFCCRDTPITDFYSLEVGFFGSNCVIMTPWAEGMTILSNEPGRYYSSRAGPIRDYHARVSRHCKCVGPRSRGIPTDEAMLPDRRALWRRSHMCRCARASAGLKAVQEYVFCY